MDHAIALLISAVTGAFFGALGYASGQRFARWWWPRPPRMPEFELSGIEIECPQCGEKIGMQISGGYGTPPEALPLGERLLREKAELQKRLDALGDADHQRSRAIAARLAAIDRELGRLH